MSERDILEFNIPTGIPMLYTSMRISSLTEARISRRPDGLRQGCRGGCTAGQGEVIYALDGLMSQLADDVYIAPNASVIGDVILAAQVSVWFGAVLRGDVEQIVVGRGSNIQDNSVLHSDPGAPLTLGRVRDGWDMVTLHGCTIGDGTLIGMGASLLNHARIGRNCRSVPYGLVTERQGVPGRHADRGFAGPGDPAADGTGT